MSKLAGTSPWLLISLCTLACDAARPASQQPALDSAAGSGGTVLTSRLEDLYDPRTCQPCHAQHFSEWQSSMHAYAASDPLFIAMNERGQRETDGELGEFCVRCHAPMALALGLTRDGLNLPQLTGDPNAQGVTCYFCHNVDAVVDDHNRGLTLANDMTMRGGLGSRDAGPSAEPNTQRARPNSMHHSTYSPLHDGQAARSAALCGACHDIVNDNEVALERTYAEWQQSDVGPDSGQTRSCAACHMARHEGPAAPDGPVRTLHRHMWPGVDVALSDRHPGVEAQKAAIACAFEDALALTLTPRSAAFDMFEVTIENRGVGHAWPSGASQDRRAWVELIAYDADDQPFFQSGVVEPGAVVGEAEPDLVVLHDQLYDADAQPVHMFWRAAPSADHPRGYESRLIPNQGQQRISYALPGSAARVTARLMLQAVGLDVIDDFAGVSLPITERVLSKDYSGSGALRGRIPTISVPGTERAWPSQPEDPGDARRRMQCAAQSYASSLRP